MSGEEESLVDLLFELSLRIVLTFIVFHVAVHLLVYILRVFLEIAVFAIFENPCSSPADWWRCRYGWM
jgi:hypothetical protein